MDTVFIVGYCYGYNECTSEGDVCACRTEEAARAKVLELQENFPNLYKRIEQARDWLGSPSANAAEKANRKPDQDYYEWRKGEIMNRFGVSDSEMCMDDNVCYGYRPLKLI